MFLRNECSDLRQIVRFLQTESPFYKAWMEQTRNSFDSQWEKIPEGKHLLTDKEFIIAMNQSLETYTKLPQEWFNGKRILDAGCGNGRWSYALASLGAKVTALDQSEHGLSDVKKMCSSFSDFDCIQADLLSPLPFAELSFDMVWSFGVLHHTGNTYKAFNHIAPLVKKGGALFLMLYGEPNNFSEFKEINNYVMHRRNSSYMNPEEKIKYCYENFDKDLVHGYFDAISPRINDLYRFDEIRDWLVMTGFEKIKRTSDNRNLVIMAWKK